MISFYPSIYASFLCKGEECKHNCCQGWAIELDDDTTSLYLNEEGEFGERLRNNITEGEEGYHFVLRDDGKCPFQEPNGLCTIILEKGEEYLSDICQNHPRFYEYYDEFEFCGVGLSCERTCEMLAEGVLSFQREEEEGVLTSTTLQSIVEEVRGGAYRPFSPSFSARELKHLLFVMHSVNILHPTWKYDIACMQEEEKELLEAGKLYWSSLDGQAALFLENVYQYILYRVLVKLDAFTLETLLLYARLSTEFILYHYVFRNKEKTLLEVVAEWSEEIEYDTENIEFLLESFLQVGV